MYICLRHKDVAAGGPYVVGADRCHIDDFLSKIGGCRVPHLERLPKFCWLPQDQCSLIKFGCSGSGVFLFKLLQQRATIRFKTATSRNESKATDLSINLPMLLIAHTHTHTHLWSVYRRRGGLSQAVRLQSLGYSILTWFVEFVNDTCVYRYYIGCIYNLEINAIFQLPIFLVHILF